MKKYNEILTEAINDVIVTESDKQLLTELKVTTNTKLLLGLNRMGRHAGEKVRDVLSKVRGTGMKKLITSLRGKKDVKSKELKVKKIKKASNLKPAMA